MGATVDTRVYKVADRKTVRTMFNEACENARYEHGHGGYTGTIAEFGGIGKWREKLFSTEREAEEYIVEHHSKWDPAMAVSFKLGDGTFGWVVGGWVSE